MDLTLDDKIRRIVVNYCDIADKDWALFRYHILHLHRFPNLSETPQKSPLGAATRLLETSMTEGEIASEDAMILASMALGVVLQTAQSKVSYHRRYLHSPAGSKNGDDNFADLHKMYLLGHARYYRHKCSRKR